MSNEITLKSLAETVNDRVRSVIVDALPDSAIEQIVKREFERLTERPTDSYSSSYRRSELEVMVGREIQKRAEAKAMALIDGLFDSQWQAGDLDTVVTTKMAELACRVGAEALVLQMLTGAMSGFRSTLQNAIYNGQFNR